MENFYLKDIKSILEKLGIDLKGKKVYSNIIFTWLYNNQEELEIDSLHSQYLGEGFEDSDLVIDKTLYLDSYYNSVKDRKFIVLSSPNYKEWAEENGITTFPASGFWKVGHKVGKGIELEKGVWYTNIENAIP